MRRATWEKRRSFSSPVLAPRDRSAGCGDAARKQAQNEYSAEKALARLLNANFTEGDLLLGLDYSDEGIARLEDWASSHGLPMETEEQQMDAMRAAADHELHVVIRR